MAGRQCRIELRSENNVLRNQLETRTRTGKLNCNELLDFLSNRWAIHRYELYSSYINFYGPPRCGPFSGLLSTLWTSVKPNASLYSVESTVWAPLSVSLPHRVAHCGHRPFCRQSLHTHYCSPPLKYQCTRCEPFARQDANRSAIDAVRRPCPANA